MDTNKTGSSTARRSGGSWLGGFLIGVLAAAAVAFLWPRVMGGTAPQPVAAGSGAAPAAAADGGMPAGPPPAPVDVVAAVETIAAEPVQLLGTVAARRNSLVASEVDGLAAELLVDEGDRVRAGQVLVRLRSTTMQMEVDAAVASKQEAVARLSRASSDFDRLANLLERRAISQREYDEAVADRDALEQSLARYDADASRLQDLLSRATVRAPFGGRVTAVHVELGEWVGTGDSIVSLVDLSEVEVSVQIAERFISAVEAGFPVDVRFDALPGELYEGIVRAVVPQAIPEARTFPVLVRVLNPGERVKGGMAGRVMAQLGSAQPAMLVSKDALVRRGDTVFIYRVRGAEGVGSAGAVEELAVETGPARGHWQIVYGALAPGDLMVVRGNERIFPGQPVRIAQVLELEVPEADPDRPIAADPQTAARQQEPSAPANPEEDNP